MELTADNLYKLWEECIFTKEDRDNRTSYELSQDPEAIIIIGMFTRFGFHKSRLYEHKYDVIDLLKQLPDKFFTNYGASLEEANTDKNGKIWGSKVQVDLLICLGFGLEIIDDLAITEPWQNLKINIPVLH